jgi:hypothetical protein
VVLSLLDIVARCDDGADIFGECKWSTISPVGVDVYSQLLGKVARHPDAAWRNNPRYLIFSAGDFTPELKTIVKRRVERCNLLECNNFLPIGYEHKAKMSIQRISLPNKLNPAPLRAHP